MTSPRTNEPTGGDPEVLKVVARGKRRRLPWVLLAAVLVAGGGGGFYVWKKKTAAAAEGTKYQSQKVERGDLRVTVTATGTLKARNTVEVGAEITGRVLEVHVNFNDKVTKGQILAEIDTEQYTARIEEATAQLASANASLMNARTTASENKLKLTRAEGMLAQGLAPAQDVEAAQANYKRAEAQVASSSSQVTLAQASLKVAKTNLSKAVIRSPIDGVVLNRAVEPGQTVTSGMQTPVLFVLAADLGQLQLNVQVDEADVGSVKEGQEASFTVDAYAQQSFVSKVLAVKNMPTTGTTVVTYEAWLSVDNTKGLLRPGMTATATVVVDERKNVLLVSNAALRFNPNRKTTSTQQQGISVNQFLPTGGRPGMGQQKRPTGTGTGTGAPREPALWLPTGGEPRRVKVEVGATDGIRTEIRAEEISEGTDVVVSMVEAPRG
ncbi:efflux RND transporter periplasmic adaptor subunit [Polyangium mundeleinium]|uniref:Efflux RND transporter periplasmic adaptor subunit n=1 Tax=Polyangium mundeleinium TaxID=2995306 RepID=A0ABT5EN80_9BACT|nr:efflux RND transporter periplasmic adaptor subunit [Polyangium mundeleinium]MDC0743295.1 efflux RND transporter periplasmic adaptor subunit [Polyangium mundeleinium]